MENKNSKYFDLPAVKIAYKEGKNITELLRFQKNVLENTPEIIETAYDLQAGSYIENILKNPKQSIAYSTELAQILDLHLRKNDSLLDVGTGELTTLSQIILRLHIKPTSVFAFDISWSRVYKGISFAKENLKDDYKAIKPFVADLNEIPLLSKSINITTSSHALEPNGGNLKEIMQELFRVTIDKLVLFEPCFEINSKEGKDRMEKLGYIKDMDGVIKELGGELLDKIKIKNISNPLNPTVCFVIKPPPAKEINSNKMSTTRDIFSVPGTNIPLKKIDACYFSSKVGLCYPTLKSIPILKSNVAILASSLCD
jgi:hypothetical protein